MGEFFHEYLAILEDPAHMAVEVTNTAIIDGLILGLLWPLIRRFIDHRLQKQHELLDQEHGIVHHGDHIHHSTDEGEHVHPVAGPGAPA